MTQIIALCSLAVFVILMIGIGLYSSKKATTVDGFLLGGRNVGPWITAFAYGTSYFSAVIFIGYAGMHGWNIGVAGMWIGFGNAIIGCLFAWIFLAKRTRRMTHELNAKTMPELFCARYNSKGMKIYAAIITFIFLVPYAASVYKGLGVLFSSIFFGASEITCMLIVAILTGIYLVLGGYVATSLNDFVQGIIMIVGIILLIAILVTRPEVGGFQAGMEKLAAIDVSLVDITGGSNAKMLITNILLTSFGVWGLPQMVHKYYAIKDEASIKVATTVSTLLAVLLGCGAYFVGSLGRLFIAADESGLPALANGYDGVVPQILMNALTGSVFTNVVLSIIMLLLLSASMSTLSAIVLSSSSAVSIDLVGEIKPDIDNKSQMIVMRVLCIVFVALSFLFATMNISFIVNLMSFSWGIVAGSFIGPYIWGLYSTKITKAGAWSGMLSGLVVVSALIIFFTTTQSFAVAKSLAPEFGVSAMAISFIAVPLVSFLERSIKGTKEA